MKALKISYWIITGLFSAFMLFSASGEIMCTPENMQFMRQLGYPDYFSPFIGIAKVLGVIAILIPGFPRIKDWAYAGLLFDIVGANYSVIKSFGFNPGMAFLILPVIFLAASYVLYHKKLKLSTNKA